MKTQESQAELDKLHNESQDGKNITSALNNNNGNVSTLLSNKNAMDNDGPNTPRELKQTDMVISTQRPNVFSSKANESPIYDSKGRLVLGASRKSIETLPMSNGGRQQAAHDAQPQPLPLIEDLMNQTGVANVTATGQNHQFAFTRNVESGEKKMLIDEKHYHHLTQQKVSTNNYEMDRFQKRNNSKRRKLGARSPYNQLYSTLKGSKNDRNFSQESYRGESNEKPTVLHHRYDMAIGIKATTASNLRVNEKQDSKEDRSMRKTVNIDFGKSQEDQLTNSVISIEDQNDSQRLNEEVQTTGSLIEEAQKQKIMVDNHYKQKLDNGSIGIGSTNNFGPTVIQLSNPGELTESHCNSSAIDQMFLGTPTQRDRPKYTGRVMTKDNIPAVAVLDHLAASQGSDDEGQSDENPQLVKLRKILLQAMKMSKTSQDKTWNQMTPFERAKIKECFQDLLRENAKIERRPGAIQTTENYLQGSPKNNADLIQDLNNCLSSQPIRQQRRPRYNSPLVSINTGVIDARLNSDLVMQPMLAGQFTNGNQESSTTRFEHFIFIDDRNLKTQIPRRICLAKDAMRNTKKSSLNGWDPAKSGTYTPNFQEAQGVDPKKVNLKIKKNKNNSQTMRNTSYAPNTGRKVITKSQATDTELDGGEFIEGTKPNSATQQNKPNQPAEQHEDENYEAYAAQFNIEDNEVQEERDNPTMFRKTPITNKAESNRQFNPEITASDKLKVSTGQFEAQIGNLYHTGGPDIFNTAGLDLDNIDPKILQQDLKIESKMIVNDMCLNSTFDSQNPKEGDDNNPENVLNINQCEDSKDQKTSSGKLSVMSLIEPPAFVKQEETSPIAQPQVITEIEAQNILTDLPKVVKYLKQQIPMRVKLAPPPEDPDLIVESTLQAISLTKQYQQQVNNQVQQIADVDPPCHIESSDKQKRAIEQMQQMAQMMIRQSRGASPTSPHSPTTAKRSGSKQSPTPQYRHLIVNSDITGLHVSGTASTNLNVQNEKSSSPKRFKNSSYMEDLMQKQMQQLASEDHQQKQQMHQFDKQQLSLQQSRIDERTSEDVTSALKDIKSGTIQNSNKLSDDLPLNQTSDDQLLLQNNREEQDDENSKTPSQMVASPSPQQLNEKSQDHDQDNMNVNDTSIQQRYEPGQNLEVQARAVTKSPTHKELGQNELDPDAQILAKKAALSKYASPSVKDTKQQQMVQIESGTDKSSIYQTFMISKLGGSGSTELQQNVLNQTGATNSKKHTKARITRIQEQFQDEEISQRAGAAPGKSNSPRKKQGAAGSFGGNTTFGAAFPGKTVGAVYGNAATTSMPPRQLYQKQQQMAAGRNRNNQNKTQHQQKYGAVRNSDGLAAWAQLTNKSSSRDMLHFFASAAANANNPTNANYACKSPTQSPNGMAILTKNTSSVIDAKMLLLENRMADYNIESLMLQGANAKGGTNSNTNSGSNTAAPSKMQFSQLMTHAVLRRSDLKGRKANKAVAASKDQQSPNQAQLAANLLNSMASQQTGVGAGDLSENGTTKLIGHVQGTKKDLAHKKHYQHQVGTHETNSRMTAKLADTENGEEASVLGYSQAVASPRTVKNQQKQQMTFKQQIVQQNFTPGTVQEGGGAMMMLSQNSSENAMMFDQQQKTANMVQSKPTSPQLIDDKLQAVNAGVGAKNKAHGSSVGKLLPASPSNKICNKKDLETSTSNPSFNNKLIPPVHGGIIKNIHHQINKGHFQGLSQGEYSIYKVNMSAAESQKSSSKVGPYKVQGTQAFAQTPSRVSAESDNCAQSSSMKQGSSALPQKRNPIQNVSNVQKLNLTQTGFIVSKNQDTVDMATMIAQQTASEDQTETNYDQRMSMRATMEEHRPRKSMMKSLIGNGAVDFNDTSEAESPSTQPPNQPNKKVNNVTQQNQQLLDLPPQKNNFKVEEDLANKIYKYSLISSKKTFGNNRSQSLAPPIISQKTIAGEQVVEDQQEITTSVPNHRNRTSISPSNKITLTKIRKTEYNATTTTTRSKRNKTYDNTTEAVFPSSQAPKQELPKMQNLNLINGGEQPLFGKKQDLRTPLDKLLTSAQMEQFQSLIGSKTYLRKQARLKGHLRINSDLTGGSNNQTQDLDLTQMLKTQTNINTMNTTFLMPGIVSYTQRSSAQGAPWSPNKAAQTKTDFHHNKSTLMTNQTTTMAAATTTTNTSKQLKFPPFNQTHPQAFNQQLDNSIISKKNTVEHVKRVKNIQAAKDNRVIFIDPLIGMVQRDPAGKTMMSPTQKKPKMKSPHDQQKLMAATNQLVHHSRKSRASPFQASGPFSFTAAQAAAATSPTANSTSGASHHQKRTSAEDKESNTGHLMKGGGPLGMPPVSKRYRSNKQRNSSDATNTFIFNDVNKLASDLSFSCCGDGDATI